MKSIGIQIASQIGEHNKILIIKQIEIIAIS